MISEVGIGTETPIFGLALNAFWKKAFHIVELTPIVDMGESLTGVNLEWDFVIANVKYCS